MQIDLSTFPLAFLSLALLIPLVHGLGWNREQLRKVTGLVLVGMAVILLYPAVVFLSDALGVAGYAIGKFVLFVLLPLVALCYAESWDVKSFLKAVGVRRERLWRSVLYGLAALVVTVVAAVLIAIVLSLQPFLDLVWSLVMFFDAFSEEFLFRGILLLYLAGKVGLRVAYPTSILGFILAHPQYFMTPDFVPFLTIQIVPTILQAVLLAIVAARTQNIIGPWVSHGLNRSVPNWILVAFGRTG